MQSGKVCLLFSVLSLAARSEMPAKWVEDMRQGLSLQSRGRLAEAESRFESALREVEQLPGQADLQAAALSHLANVEIDLSRPEEASRLCQRAISILVQSAGEADARVQSLRIELAGLYVESGQTTTAAKLLHKIIAFQASNAQTASPEGAFALDVLATLYAREKKLVAAEAAERQSLLVLEALPPAHVAAVAVGDLHLSIFLNARKRAAEALPYAERAKTIFETLPLPEPPMEAAADMSLASIHASLGRRGEAEAESERAFRVVESFYGPNHPQTAWMLLAHAAVLRRIDRKQEARVIQKRGERILREAGKNYLGETVPVEALLPH